MRTTIILRDEHRDRLLKLAAERGDRGFSKLIDEALIGYLTDLDRPPAPVSARALPEAPGRATFVRDLWGQVWDVSNAGLGRIARLLRSRLARASV